MNFGIWSNGWRPHTSPQLAYEEDLKEIVLADELGMRDAWISEHHAEAVYVGRVDVLPAPDLLMCKAAALTKRIRFGAAVKVIHLMHPVDSALQAATAAHVVGDGRYIFGFGSGFPNPVFSEERGMSDEQRRERTAEALELILECWAREEPFDWNGRFWSGRNITVLPKPPVGMPIATATFSPETLRLAGERGYLALTAGSPAIMRKNAISYAQAAEGAGHANPIDKLIATASIYVADSEAEGIEDLRAGIEYELTFYRERGLLKMLGANLGMEDVTFDSLLAAGQYVIGDPESVCERLEALYEESGGFGTLLYRCGKGWAEPLKIETSMRRFMAEVAPRLSKLTPTLTAAG